MDVRNRADQLREASNPLFNDRKLKLGTFCSNLSGGATMSSIDGVLQAHWPSTEAIARMADEMQLEAVVPVGRWKGFGGSTNFNGEGFECFTWAAAMGALTKHPAVFATSHVPTMHPVMAAKQGATIDHISGGRFTLNVVTGWYRPEIEMFGAPLLEHDTRYDMAIEWIEIIKRLWTSEEEFDFEGKFYKVKGAHHRAEAAAEAASGDHERRRFAQGSAVRRTPRRRQFRQSRGARSRQYAGAGRSVAQDRVGRMQARNPGLDQRLHFSGRHRGRCARLL